MEYIQEYLEHLSNEKKYSIHTVNNYKRIYLKYESYLKKINKKESTCSAKEFKDYIYSLYNLEYETTTISHYISALKSLYRYMHEKDYITENITENIVYPKQKHRLYKIMYSKEMEVFFQTIQESSKYKNRDEVMFLMLYTTGIRVSELTNLKIKDINYSERNVKIFGKGKKERIVPLKKEIIDKLNIYIMGERNILLTNKQDNNITSEYIFINHRGGNMTTRGVRYITTSICKKSGNKIEVSPHVFRHTLATNLLNNGMNLRSIQVLLGHESLSVTERYTHISKEDLKKQYNLLMEE